MIKAPKDVVHFYDNLFKCNFFFSYGHTEEKFIEDYSDFMGSNLTDKLKNYSGICLLIINDETDLIWVWTDSKDSFNLAHECLHATNFILSDRGIVTGKSDELQCYYMELLMRKARGVI